MSSEGIKRNIDLIWVNHSWSVIRQKGKFENGYYNTRGKKGLFFGKFGVLCFRKNKARFAIRPFAL